MKQYELNYLHRILKSFSDAHIFELHSKEVVIKASHQQSSANKYRSLQFEEGVPTPGDILLYSRWGALVINPQSLMDGFWNNRWSSWVIADAPSTLLTQVDSIKRALTAINHEMGALVKLGYYVPIAIAFDEEKPIYRGMNKEEATEIALLGKNIVPYIPENVNFLSWQDGILPVLYGSVTEGLRKLNINIIEAEQVGLTPKTNIINWQEIWQSII